MELLYPIISNKNQTSTTFYVSPLLFDLSYPNFYWLEFQNGHLLLTNCYYPLEENRSLLHNENW